MCMCMQAYMGERTHLSCQQRLYDVAFAPRRGRVQRRLVALSHCRSCWCVCVGVCVGVFVRGCVGVCGGVEGPGYEAIEGVQAGLRYLVGRGGRKELRCLDEGVRGGVQAGQRCLLYRTKRPDRG